NEVWESDFATNQMLWLENRLPGIGLLEVPLESYTEAFAKVLHPEDKMVHHHAIVAAVEANEPSCSFTFRIVRPDGEIRHLRDYIVILRDEAGKPKGALGSTIDITDQVRTIDAAENA